MRFALALLAALVLTVLVACGSEDDATKAAPATLLQQMLKAEDDRFKARSCRRET